MSLLALRWKRIIIGTLPLNLSKTNTLSSNDLSTSGKIVLSLRSTHLPDDISNLVVSEK